MNPTSSSRLARGATVATVAVAAALLALALSSNGHAHVERAQVIPPPPRGIVVLASLREAGGLSMFGVRIVDATHYADVLFLTNPDCSRSIGQGDHWPTSDSPCTSPVPIVGTVSGIGTTASGDPLIGVEFEVARACFAQLHPGMDWPPNLRECEAPRT
jgi:hypothetical protein